MARVGDWWAEYQEKRRDQETSRNPKSQGPRNTLRTAGKIQTFCRKYFPNSGYGPQVSPPSGFSTYPGWGICGTRRSTDMETSECEKLEYLKRECQEACLPISSFTALSPSRCVQKEGSLELLFELHYLLESISVNGGLNSFKYSREKNENRWPNLFSTLIRKNTNACIA